MTFKHYSIIGLILALSVFLLVRCSVRPHKVSPSQTNVLKPQESARLIVGAHHLITVTPKGTTKQYVPDSGNVTISIQKNGEVKTHVKEAGFSFHPGIGIIFADQTRLSLDTQVGYYGRFGLHLGLGLRDAPLLVGLVGGSYRLDQIHLENTSLFAGKVLGNRLWFIGLRVEL